MCRMQNGWGKDPVCWLKMLPSIQQGTGKCCHYFSCWAVSWWECGDEKEEGSCGRSARWDRSVNQIKLSGAQPSVTQRLFWRWQDIIKTLVFPPSHHTLTSQPGVKSDKRRSSTVLVLGNWTGGRGQNWICMQDPASLYNHPTCALGWKKSWTTFVSLLSPLKWIE